MSRLSRTLAAVFVTASLIMIGSPLAYAATDTASGAVDSGTGYRISPVRTDLEIAAGTSKTVRVYIKNISANQENLKVLINDFRSDGENGAPALYLNNQVAPRNSLKQYVTPQLNATVLKPDEQKAVDILITIPPTAKPGGYFGAVRFAPADAKGNDTVNLAASVASLVLVTVPGNYKEQVAVTSFGTAQEGRERSFFMNGKKLQAVVRFKNSGDVQEQPFGKVMLRKGSTTLGTYEINNTTPRGNILPDSIRKFSVDLHKAEPARGARQVDRVSELGFGKYTLEGNFGYGNKGQLLSAKTSFYVIPLALIIAVLLGLLILVFLIFGLPRLMRRYKRRVIRESRGQR